MKKFFKRKWALPLSIFLALFLLLFAIVGAPMIDRQFNSAEWKTIGKYMKRNWPISAGDYRRAAMVEDLRAHHLKIGMKRSQVEKLLGPNDGSSGGSNEGDFVNYWLTEAPTSFSLKKAPDFQFWQGQLKRRYGRADPTLAIEYDKSNRFVAAITIN